MRRNKIIISPDYDGYLSFFLFKKYFNPKAEIYGKYQTYQKQLDGSSCSVLSLKEKKFNKEEILAIDLDINYFDSLGHHYLLSSITQTYSGKHTNFNLECSNTNFYQKCPFSTVILLMYYSPKFREDVRGLFVNEDYRKIAYLLYADNFIVIFKKYANNVRDWLYKKELGWLYTLILMNYEKIMIETKKLKEELILNHNFVSSDSEYYPQSIKSKIEYESQFVNYLSQLFNVEQYDLNFTGFQKKFINLRIEPKQAKNYKDIFSHAVINSNTISISVGKL